MIGCERGWSAVAWGWLGWCTTKPAVEERGGSLEMRVGAGEMGKK